MEVFKISENLKMFWDISRPLSYNALFNFIVGPRGAGKTYGAKKYAINRFKKKHREFIYLRRYKPELEDIDKFFDDVRNELPDDELKVKGKKFYINGEYAGRAMVLSTSKIKKSVAMPNVDLIIFDEFIIDKGVYHYLPGDVVYFLEFYETVARMRDDVIVFFLSNALTVSNPYFLYFDLKLPYNTDISCKNNILIQYFVNEVLAEKKSHTRFGQIISGTSYGNYAINNEFLRDDSSFVEKKSGACQFLFAFKYLDDVFGVWQNIKAGKMYVSKDRDTTRPILYALTKDDHEPNTLLLSSIRSSPYFKRFLQQYQLGNVFFETQQIKNACYDVVKMAHIY